jgi:hypothetical protein
MEIWCGLLMAPAYNETIHGLIAEGMVSGAREFRDTSSSHSLMSAFPGCGLIVQYPSFLISEAWIRANHQMSLETRFGACFQGVWKEVLWLLDWHASNLQR